MGDFNSLKESIDKFMQDKILYGDEIFIKSRSKILKADCLQFVTRVFDQLDWKDKKIERFEGFIDERIETAPDSFEDLEIGDVCYFFIPGRNEKRGYNRIHHHVAIKYSEDAIAHLCRTGQPVKIEKLEEYRRAKNLITKSFLKTMKVENYKNN